MMSDDRPFFVFGDALEGASCAAMIKLAAMKAGTLFITGGTPPSLLAAGPIKSSCISVGIHCTEAAFVKALPSVLPVAGLAFVVVGGAAAIIAYRKEILAMIKSAWQIYLDTADECRKWVMEMLKEMKQCVEQAFDNLLACLQSRFETIEREERRLTQERKDPQEIIENMKCLEERKSKLRSSGISFVLNLNLDKNVDTFKEESGEDLQEPEVVLLDKMKSLGLWTEERIKRL